jgi:uncharacterized protein
MRRGQRWTLTLITTLAMTLPFPPEAHAQQSNTKVVGRWVGRLEAGGGLTIVFNISQGQDGALKATMDSPDQGANGIAVSDATFTNDTLRMAVAMVQGRYEGRLSGDGSKITGTWQQSGLSMPLDLAKGSAPERESKPQEPKGPLPYDATDVTFHNTSANIDLAGTLTMPRGAGPFPAAVLISGSGPQDRDESLLGHKPFLVLADYLTRHGIAVLRYDDRGTAKSKGSFATATTQDFTTDALAALEFLKTREKIASSQIGLIGHSEGGLIAPLAASRSKDVAYVVMLAGPGVPGSEILLAQVEKIARANGESEANIRRAVDMQKRIHAELVSGDDAQTMRTRLGDLLRASIDSLPAAERAQLGDDPNAIDRYIAQQIAQITSPWFRYFLTWDPRPALEKVMVPVLALNGDLDVQVPADQNLPEIEAALRKAGNHDVTLKRLPRLNHLFQTATTGSPTEYADIQETMSPTALDMIASWINARFKGGSASD